MNRLILSGEQAKQARNELGLSQRAVASGAKVNRPFLSKFERGEVIVDDDFQQQLRDYLESSGYEFPDPDSENEDSIDLPTVPGPAGFYVMDGFLVAASLPAEQAEIILDEFHQVKTEIESIQCQPLAFENDDWDWWDEDPEFTAECQQDSQRLVLLMARAYNLVHKLKGFPVVDPTNPVDEEGNPIVPVDQGGLLGQTFAWLADGLLEDDETAEVV